MKINKMLDEILEINREHEKELQAARELLNKSKDLIADSFPMGPVEKFFAIVKARHYYKLSDRKTEEDGLKYAEKKAAVIKKFLGIN